MWIHHGPRKPWVFLDSHQPKLLGCPIILLMVESRRRYCLPEIPQAPLHVVLTVPKRCARTSVPAPRRKVHLVVHLPPQGRWAQMTSPPTHRSPARRAGSKTPLPQHPRVGERNSNPLFRANSVPHPHSPYLGAINLMTTSEFPAELGDKFVQDPPPVGQGDPGACGRRPASSNSALSRPHPSPNPYPSREWVSSTHPAEKFKIKNYNTDI